MKIQNDDNKTWLFTELFSYGVFTALVAHVMSLVTKERSLSSGLSLADEVLVTILKLSEHKPINWLGLYLTCIHETKVSKIWIK